MIKKVLLALCMLTLFSTTVLGTCAESLCMALQEAGVKEDRYIPQAIPFKNEVLGVYTHSGEVIMGVTVKDGVITQSDCCEEREGISYKIEVDQETVDECLESENRLDTALLKLDNGDIKVTGMTFGSSVKLIIGTAVLKFTRLFW